ncbi:MAG: hypothetical protein Q9166_002668 [cf. Caloplaca sp. 2 TL-2023]
MGLQRQKFPYVHLHRRLPESGQPSNETKNLRTTRESSAELAKIYEPPRSDSGSISPPAPESPASEPDTAPPPKRRRLESRETQPVDLTGPSPVKKEQNSGDIRPTRFTASNASSSQKNSGARKSAISNQSRNVDSNDSEDPFAFQKASQRKVQKLYRSKQGMPNIHKATPTKPEEKQPTKERRKTESIVKINNNGFKTADTDVLCAMVKTPEHKRAENQFRVPVALSPSPRSQPASQQSTDEAAPGLRPARAKTHRKLSQSQSFPKQEPSPPKFKIPKGLGSGSDDQYSSKSTKSSQDISMPDAPLAQTLETAQRLADNAASLGEKLKVEFNAPDSSATVSSGPTFDLDIEDGDSSSLSSAPDIQELDALDFHDQWLKAHPPSSPKSKCPICKTFVSRLFLEEFFGSGILNVRQQFQFCKAHKVRSAEEVWRKKGFPSINWQKFKERLPKYEDDVAGVLNGTRRSFYRNAFDDQVKRGVNRTLQQAMMSENGLEGLNMGYYGTKGARILMDYTMSKFASRLRRLAATDKLVSAGGVAGFVQAVLAPELAVMLVKDDMNVDEEQARVILSESSDIGNLLNEEEDEVIRDAAERDAAEQEATQLE